MSKNDVAWEKLFAKYGILEEIRQAGIFKISATQINEFREARLMTKYDHKVNLPKVFRDNGLSILPDSRGTYLIGEFEAYQDVLQSSIVEGLEPAEFHFPIGIETIDYTNLYSEVSALLCAYNTGMVADVVGEDVRLTVMGRMSTSQFSYQVRDRRNCQLHTINVNNAQCEIDGGFEGETKLILIEAKNYTVDDFLIRQLYYPYRLWQAKTNKEVVPVFMTYSNDVFTFLIYRFHDEVEYNSIELVAQKTYQIAPDNIALGDIYEVFCTTPVKVEPANAPFPQADKFERVIDLLGLLYESDLSQQEVTQTYQFDKRQAQYYISACIYFGLVQKSANIPVTYSLSDTGRIILQKSSKKKYLAIIEQILQHEVFHRTIELYFAKSARPSKSEVVQIMHNAHINLSQTSTIPRRAQTVLAWVDWILRLCRTE
jgi:hypothetical protein